MKKIFLILFGAFLISAQVCASSVTPSARVYFSVLYHAAVNPGPDNDAIGNHGPKSPVASPIVYIEDHTLSFVADHPDYLLTIKDEDGEEVYSATVYSVETEVILPSFLSGTYQIELIMGNWIFIGEIVL